MDLLPGSPTEPAKAHPVAAGGCNPPPPPAIHIPPLAARFRSRTQACPGSPCVPRLRFNVPSHSSGVGSQTREQAWSRSNQSTTWGSSTQAGPRKYPYPLLLIITNHIWTSFLCQPTFIVIVLRPFHFVTRKWSGESHPDCQAFADWAATITAGHLS